MTVAELIQLHRTGAVFHGADRGADVARRRCAMRRDRTPALLQLLWDRYGVLPRNLIFVEVTHRKVPYIHDDRYRGHGVRPGRERAAASSASS